MISLGLNNCDGYRLIILRIEIRCYILWNIFVYLGIVLNIIKKYI
jgi:hypothetical protein